MSILIINLQRKILVDTNLLRRQAQCIRNAFDSAQFSQHSLSIFLASNARVSKLNAQFAARPYPTDVLSFRLADPPMHSTPPLPDPPLHELPNAPYLDLDTRQIAPAPPAHFDHLSKDLGSIFLAPDFCQQQSIKRGIRLCDYLLLATAHAIAHLVGYDHHTPLDYDRMKRAEQHVLRQVQIHVGLGSCDYDRRRNKIRTPDRFPHYQLPASYLP